MRISIILLLLLLISSCKKKDDPTPAIDADIAAFEKVLVGKWNCLGTQTLYPTGAGASVFPLFGNVDCTKELQWDYLKSMTISKDMRVINEFYCVASRTTTFEVIKMTPKNSTVQFYIVEKDQSGNAIKIYAVNATTDPSQYLLQSTIFDTSYFYPSKVGSIPASPIQYSITIQKQ